MSVADWTIWEIWVKALECYTAKHVSGDPPCTECPYDGKVKCPGMEDAGITEVNGNA